MEKDKRLFYGILVVVLVILGIGLFILSKPTEPTNVPEDFDIYYSFGVGEQNIFDMKNNLYVKDMVCDPIEKYTVQLSESDKIAIYNSILENDLFNIKGEFTKNCNSEGVCVTTTPLSTATLRITIDGKTKTIKWSANYIDRDDPDLKKFMNVEKVIQGIISQKEKEMFIPEPRCGYI